MTALHRLHQRLLDYLRPSHVSDILLFIGYNICLDKSMCISRLLGGRIQRMRLLVWTLAQCAQLMKIIGVIFAPLFASML